MLDIGRHRRAWLLSVDGRRAKKADGSLLCHGYGMPNPRPFSAVFAYGGRLWLQVGKRRWDVEDILSVEQEKDGFKRATYDIRLRDGSHNEVTIKFPLSVAVLRLVDPTRDEIDSWSEDIMKMLPYTAADGWRSSPSEGVAEWAARTLPKWAAGFDAVPRAERHE